MTLRYLLRIFILVSGALAAAPALAERKLVEGTIQVDGQQRRYFRLYDAGSDEQSTPILLISGSGCGAFGHRIPSGWSHLIDDATTGYARLTGQA